MPYTFSCPLQGRDGSRQNETTKFWIWVPVKQISFYTQIPTTHRPKICLFFFCLLSIKLSFMAPNTTKLDNGHNLLTFLHNFPTTHFISLILHVLFSHVFIEKFFLSIKTKESSIFPSEKCIALIRWFLSVLTVLVTTANHLGQCFSLSTYLLFAF